MFPLDFCSKPHKIDNIVDFPHPLGPTIATNSPGFNSREKSSTAKISCCLV